MDYFSIIGDSISATDSIVTNTSVAAQHGPYPTIISDTLVVEGSSLATQVYNQADTVRFALRALPYDYLGVSTDTAIDAGVYQIFGSAILNDTIRLNQTIASNNWFLIRCTGKLTFGSNFRLLAPGLGFRDIFFLADSGIVVENGSVVSACLFSQTGIRVSTSSNTLAAYANGRFSYEGLR